MSTSLGQVKVRVCLLSWEITSAVILRCPYVSGGNIKGRAMTIGYIIFLGSECSAITHVYDQSQSVYEGAGQGPLFD